MTTELITIGRHKATCFEFEFPEPAAGKAQGIALGFRLSDGDVDQGRVITAWKYFSDGALAYTIEALRACGWKGDDPSEITMADLANEVELVIQHEEYPFGSGDWKAKVAFINVLGGGMVKAEKRLEGNDLKKFGAAMKAKIRAVGAGAKRERPAAATGNGQHTTRQAAPHPNAPGGGGDWGAPPPRRRWPDDDIPFAACGIGFEPSAIASVLRRGI